MDHPRVCGEQIGGRILGAGLKGSPPRVRGTVYEGAAALVADRITPACAGNSRGHRQPDRGNQDHPRVCGEQEKPGQSSPRSRGSPPRVRGTVYEDWKSFIRAGITPACAGNSLHLPKFYDMMWDHPRVCGEQPERPPKGVDSTGSPPRVRGTATPRRTSVRC